MKRKPAIALEKGENEKQQNRQGFKNVVVKIHWESIRDMAGTNRKKKGRKDAGYGT